MLLEPWQLDLVDSCRSATLATIDRTGTPSLVPVCYAYVEGRFVIAIDEKPKSGRPLARVRNIDADPRVTLLIDHYDDDWTRLAWLRIEGTAVAIGAAAWPGAVAALRSRYHQYEQMAIERLPLIVITPGRAVAWRWRA
ncbi:MAG TPA: TIGR03668 family PPOX class F420-dependent oxidoreductase [Tepidiformaceae bacterium]|nr:TIGR03668 family PPOX class F420-dependent oxidoreductase [Tepidiformaceae bacterium]